MAEEGHLRKGSEKLSPSLGILTTTSRIRDAAVWEAEEQQGLWTSAGLLSSEEKASRLQPWQLREQSVVRTGGRLTEPTRARSVGCNGFEFP